MTHKGFVGLAIFIGLGIGFVYGFNMGQASIYNESDKIYLNSILENSYGTFVIHASGKTAVEATESLEKKIEQAEKLKWFTLGASDFIENKDGIILSQVIYRQENEQ